MKINHDLSSEQIPTGFQAEPGARTLSICEPTPKQVTVAVILLLWASLSAQSAFIESGGLVVMEAEHFTSSSSPLDHSWVPDNSIAGFTGSTAMFASPNVGTNLAANVTTTSPGLKYLVQFSRTGQYRLWVRGWGATLSDNSVFVGLDGETPEALGFALTGAWTWESTNLVSIATAGLHEINIWMREDGTYVDRLILTTNLAYVPSGAGPAKSAQAPGVQLSNPADGAKIPLGATVAISAEATDKDGYVATVSFFVDGVLTVQDSAAPFSCTWTPVNSGTYRLSAVATDDTGNVATSDEIMVEVTAPPTGIGVFRESEGMVVMEAEHFATSVAASGHAWVPTNNVTGFVGSSAMRASPNTGASITANVTSASPGLKYQVFFQHTGTYRFWLRGWAANGSDDSVHIGMDRLTPQSLSLGQTGAWVWNAGSIAITNVGMHEINLWMREDGAYVDRLLLTTNSAFIPTGNGPPETSPPTASFRYASGTRRIYVENGGTVTLSDIRAALPNAPLCLIDPVKHIWFLDATLMLTDGTKLKLYGSSVGGDVNELRLRSDNSTAEFSCAVIDADWGILDLKNVKVISWDQLTGAPDKEYATYQRAFIRARSRQEGATVQQSVLNVVDSEIGYLGVASSDSYGLTWDVVGSSPDASVFGVVTNCFVHDCVLGLPTGLWDDVLWTGNRVVTNKMYGFNPIGSNVVTNNSFTVDYRWAGVSQRIYVTGPGEATLSEIKKALPTAPLSLVNSNSKTWYLGAHLFVENGAKLKLYGPAIGGDVAELRLKSENTSNANAFVEVRADWGWLDIRNTKITSWINSRNGPDTETDTFRRAYVRARSKLDPDGVTARESRMDVINSEICYLGSHNTEAYGLVWKVVDTTAVYLPSGSAEDLFDVVNVYGDILNSRIHHNYFGVYSYGHHGGRWATNEVYNNIHYGFDPHDDSDYLVIEGNNVHHNGWHGIIASKRCDHGILRNNKSWNNGLDLIEPHGNGIMLHRSCNDWVVENNQSYGNTDTGIAIFACDRTLIRNNVCLSNANAGIRLSVGSENNRVEGNELGFRQRYGFYVYEGNDPPEPDDAGVNWGRCQRNVFTNNFVHDYTAEALKVSNCDSNTFAGNVFLGAGTVLRFESGTNNVVSSNIVPADTFVRLADSEVTNGPPRFNSTTFAGQSRLAVQVDLRSTGTFVNQSGGIFSSDQVSLTNVVRTTGSSVVLNTSRVGVGVNTVFMRNLFALPGSGSAQVSVLTWSIFGSRTKVWTVQASSGSIQISYQVGDLSPGTSYSVRRGSTQIATRTANSQGYVSFTASPGSTALTTYTVTRI